MKSHRTSCKLQAFKHGWVGEDHDNDVKANQKLRQEFRMEISEDKGADLARIDRSIAGIDEQIAAVDTEFPMGGIPKDPITTGAGLLLIAGAIGAITDWMEEILQPPPGIEIK